METGVNTSCRSSHEDKRRSRSRNANRNCAKINGACQAPEALGLRDYDRVRELGEVFTAEREVNDMLDLVAEGLEDIDSRFLEPSCGNGNFLVAILDRKLDLAFERGKKQENYEYFSLAALASIYGIDIDLENIQESRLRMHTHMLDSYSYRLNTVRPTRGYLSAIDYVLERNIVHGDFLNEAHNILLTEFTRMSRKMFGQNVFRLSDLLTNEGTLNLDTLPELAIEPKCYWELAGK